MRFASLLLSLLLMTALLSDGFAHGQSQAKPRPKPTRGIAGQQAPDWSVSTWHQLPAGRETLNVSDYKGKVLYLYFFQSWCPGCHSTGFPHLQKLHTKFKDDPNVDFAVIQTTFEGHSVNTADKLAPTAAKFKLPIPFGQSKERSGTPDIMRKYRTGGTPWVVIIDKEGTVRFNDFHADPEKVIPFIEQLRRL